MIFHLSAGRLAPALVALGVLGAGLAGCGSAQVSTGKTEERNLSLTHEACDLDGARTVDVNGDGQPDLWHVESGGREVCRAIDLNLDGVKDAFIYYDAQGRERRRESDFDRDGYPDEISHSEAGVVVLKERETNYDAKLDTWDYYEGGRLARRERDSSGDGKIDQWWTFGSEDPKCAVVVSDGNADGEPDPGSEVDLCGEGYKPPPVTPPPATATAATSEEAAPAAPPAVPATPASATKPEEPPKP